jgi:hypothetical protein
MLLFCGNSHCWESTDTEQLIKCRREQIVFLNVTIPTYIWICCVETTILVLHLSILLQLVLEFIFICLPSIWARGSVVGWGTMLKAGRSPVRVPDDLDFFNLPNPSSRTMALGSTQPLTKISTRDLPGRKSSRLVGLTNLPPSVSRMSENVVASTSRNPKNLHGLYRDKFTLPFYLYRPSYITLHTW